jgi:ATP-binding cassette subfamily A (ABC1) protein 3
MSFVMGMRKIPYWFGTFLFDMILFWIPSLVVIIIIACFPSAQSSVYVDKFGYFFIIFLAFSLSFLPFTYMWSHAFQKAQTAYRFFPFFMMIIFAIVPQIPIYIVPENQFLKYVLPILSPLLALVNAMVSK